MQGVYFELLERLFKADERKKLESYYLKLNSIYIMALQIILAREYLKDVIINREQLKYLVMEALRGGCQVFSIKLS